MPRVIWVMTAVCVRRKLFIAESGGILLADKQPLLEQPEQEALSSFHHNTSHALPSLPQQSGQLYQGQFSTAFGLCGLDLSSTYNLSP
jgi:hypothetical protein